MKLVIKTALMTGSFLLAAAKAGTVSAHDITDALPEAKGKIDFYTVTCSDNGAGPPHHVVVQLEEIAPAAVPVIRVLVSKGGAQVTATDPTDGSGGPGPAVTLNQGPGEYQLKISKNAAGIDSYEITAHCETNPASGNAHTGTNIIRLCQNKKPSKCPFL